MQKSNKKKEKFSTTGTYNSLERSAYLDKCIKTLLKNYNNKNMSFSELSIFSFPSTFSEKSDIMEEKKNNNVQLVVKSSIYCVSQRNRENPSFLRYKCDFCNAKYSLLNHWMIFYDSPNCVLPICFDCSVVLNKNTRNEIKK